jgi:hypothetical protein
MPRFSQGPPVRPKTEPDGIGAAFALHLARQESLCGELEGMADSLPHKLDTQLALELGRQLHPVLRRAHRFEEEVAHPILLACHPRLAATLGRLRDEHVEDEDRAHELRDAIIKLVRDRSRREAETVGYMLRGFFSGLRRHLAFEREQLLPLLSDEDP